MVLGSLEQKILLLGAPPFSPVLTLGTPLTGNAEIDVLPTFPWIINVYFDFLKIVND
jgi:hypothetical protein